MSYLLTLCELGYHIYSIFTFSYLEYHNYVLFNEPLRTIVTHVPTIWGLGYHASQILFICAWTIIFI